ncbi:MurR/RpiR family transcriptional regulator [Brevirhabdus sp.]|uniref:MurR/RpiR family transcriptional regulator n=1 Tax=Brevirhabdus sp. TaxID=2004514 RepID=UPI0040588CF2
MNAESFSDRVATLADDLTPAEARVIGYLTRNRETALHASAAGIAASAQTSDATVIRTARRLGYGGLDALRKGLAEDLRRDLTLADRMDSDLARAGEDGILTVATTTLRASLDAIDGLAGDDVAMATDILSRAARVHVFGIGPSGFIAGYFAAQLGRLGLDARAMTRTGVQCADDLIALRPGDAVIALAYDRPYPEVRALFDQVGALGLRSVLLSSTGTRLPDARATLTLRVPRGRTDGFGLHAGTLALLEGLLMALCAAEPARSATALRALNTARQALSGGGMDL